jgi:hypothetical protein
MQRRPVAPRLAARVVAGHVELAGYRQWAVVKAQVGRTAD